jgi:hypothetical protein
MYLHARYGTHNVDLLLFNPDQNPYVTNVLVKVHSIKLNTSPKYMWTFSTVLIFTHKYNVSKVLPEEETLYMCINIKAMEEVQMYFTDVSSAPLSKKFHVTSIKFNDTKQFTILIASLNNPYKSRIYQKHNRFPVYHLAAFLNMARIKTIMLKGSFSQMFIQNSPKIRVYSWH